MTYNLFLTILLLFPSCSTPVDGKDPAFSEKQLDFVNPYKTNDTLVFENKNYLPDTIIIHSFTKGKDFINLAIRPMFAGNWQETKASWGATPPFQQFITLSKPAEQDKGSVSISFKGFQCTFNPDTIKSTKQLTLGDKTYSCYVLRHQFPGTIKDNSYIITLFWNKKTGLVAYQARGGGSWTLKTR